MNGLRTVKRCSFFTSLAVFISAVLLTAFLAGIFFFESSPVAAQAYRYVAHSNKDTGAQYIYSPTYSGDATDTGSCRNCHIEHASWNSGASTINAGSALTKPNSTASIPRVIAQVTNR